MEGENQLAASIEPGAEAERVQFETFCVDIRTAWCPGEHLFAAELDGQKRWFQVEHQGVHWQLTSGGYRTRFLVTHARGARLNALMPEKAPPDLSRFLLSPMPGLLLSVSVSEGEPVKAEPGQHTCCE